MEKQRVLIQQPFLAPYRVPFFRALDHSQLLSPTFAVGNAPRKTVPVEGSAESLASVVRLRNVKVLADKGFTIQLGLLRLIRGGSFDAVIAGLDPRFVSTLLAFALARRKGIPFLWWGHGIRPRGRHTKFYCNLVSRSSGVILYSNAAQRELTCMGIPAHLITVARNSIDLTEIASLATPDSEERQNLLFIGRLVPEKKLRLLLAAFSLATSQLPPGTRLSIIGGGVSEPECRDLTNELTISQLVDWHGPLYEPSDLAPIMNSAILSVSPGYVGLSAVTSLAFSVPVAFAAGDPHSPESELLCVGTNSLTFPSDNPAALAACMVQALRKRDHLREFGLSGFRSVHGELGVHRMVTSFERALEKATLPLREQPIKVATLP